MSPHWIAWALGLFCLSLILFLVICILVVAGRESQKERDAYGIDADM